MTEAIAQLMFWMGMGALPFSLVLLVVGMITKNRQLSILCLVAVPMAVAHFFWYFKMLGTGLGDKTGNAEYPSWWLYMGIAVLIGLPLGAIAAVWEKGRAKISTANNLV